MKALVLKTFIDKNTGIQHLEGSTIECAIDRGQFLAEKGFAKILGDVKAEPVETKEAKAENKPKTTKAAPKKTTTTKKKS